MKIKVLLVDDHKIVRDGLRALLEKEADMAVVSESDNGRDAVKLAGEILPDVLVMDIAMPEMNGVDAARRIVADNPECGILVLSMLGDKRFVIEMLNAGVKGYLLKDCAADELVRAIRAIHRGEMYLSPHISGCIIKDIINQVPEAPPVLTLREREVLQLLAEGKKAKEIAYMLCLSSKTVDTFRQSIMKKLGINSVAELTKYAIREGLTSL